MYSILYNVYNVQYIFPVELELELELDACVYYYYCIVLYV